MTTEGNGGKMSDMKTREARAESTERPVGTAPRAVRGGRGATALPTALVAAVLLALVVGCRKEEEPVPAPKPKPDPSSPESYMNDKEFRGRLAAERKEHVALIQGRNAIAEKMKEMIEAKKAELKTDDLEKVRVELEKDPAWNDLYSQCTNANAKVEEHSRKRLGIVRDRIAPSGKRPVGRGGPTAPTTTKQPISK